MERAKQGPLLCLSISVVTSRQPPSERRPSIRAAVWADKVIWLVGPFHLHRRGAFEASGYSLCTSSHIPLIVTIAPLCWATQKEGRRPSAPRTTLGRLSRRRVTASRGAEMPPARNWWCLNSNKPCTLWCVFCYPSATGVTS